MIGSSQVAPRLRAIVKGRDEIDFVLLVKQVCGVVASELRPIQRAIVEAELVDIGWRRRPRDTWWERG